MVLRLKPRNARYLNRILNMIMITFFSKTHKTTKFQYLLSALKHAGKNRVPLRHTQLKSLLKMDNINMKYVIIDEYKTDEYNFSILKY